MSKKKKNANAVALGRLGGLKGGKARAHKLTPEERSESARKASQARWARAAKEIRKTLVCTARSLPFLPLSAYHCFELSPNENHLYSNG